MEKENNQDRDDSEDNHKPAVRESKDDNDVSDSEEKEPTLRKEGRSTSASVMKSFESISSLMKKDSPSILRIRSY